MTKKIHALKSRSGKKRVEESDSFVASAGRPSSAPWESARRDVVKTFNLRLTEKEYLMLKFIADNTPLSRHEFIMDVLRPALQRKARDISG